MKDGEYTLQEIKDQLQELCYQGCSQYKIKLDKSFHLEYTIDRDNHIIYIQGRK